MSVRTAFLILMSITLMSWYSVIAIAQETDEREIVIAEQALPDSLKSVADEFGLQLAFFSEVAEDFEAPALSGSYTQDQALEALLAETMLEYGYIDDGTVVVRAKDQGGDSDSKNLAHPQPVLMAQNQDRTRAQSGEVVEESEEQEPVWIEEIIVTGSNIRGISPDSSPLFILDREGIDRAGFGTVEQLMQSLPQNFGGGATVNTFGAVPDDVDSAGNFSRGTAINLRGLGSDSALVLLNGRRLAPTLLSSFVDISIIPLSAVERVEVLTDGASAIYGSDAVAGVVNFVLRDDYEGAETLLRYGTVTDGSLDEYKASQTFGGRWQSGNALIVYEYFNQSNLPAADRDFVVDAGASPDLDLFPDSERHSVFASATQELSDRVKISVDGLYANRDVDSNATSGFPLLFETDTEQYSIAGDVWIELGGSWGLQVAGSYATDNAFSLSDFSLFGVTIGGDLENRLSAIDAKADGALFDLPGGDVRLVVGANYRREEFENTQITTTTFGATTDVFEADRDIFAAYGELFIPLVSEKNRLPGVERLEVSVAGRFEDYNDFGSSTDPKVGVLWSPLSGVNLRGTYSTSFRAPNLDDLNPSFFQTQLLNLDDPSDLVDGRSLVLLLLGNSGELGPEESTAWTVGVDYEPEFLPGFRFSGTYYDIDFDDRIDPPTTNSFIVLGQPDIFAPIITFDPTSEQIADALDTPVFNDFTGSPGFGPPGVPEDADVIINNTTQNISETNTRGIDLSFSYLLETQAGDFSFGLSGNYIFDFERAITPTAPLVDLADTVFNPAELRFRANVGWSKDGFVATAFVNHTGSYVDNVSVPEMTVDSWTTVDLSLSFDTKERFDTWILNNVRLALNIQNVFDEDPPLIQVPGSSSFNSLGYDPANASPLNRFIAVQISKAW